MEAESYANPEISRFINENFLAVTANIKVRGTWFHRFEVLWTPTILLFDPTGAERFRIEGYLPSEEFTAQLELGLGRISFMQKDWTTAEHRYGGITKNRAGTFALPEAMYWETVARYKRTNDHTILPVVAERLRAAGRNIWATKASVWLPEKATLGKSAS